MSSVEQVAAAAAQLSVAERLAIIHAVVTAPPVRPERAPAFSTTIWRRSQHCTTWPP